MSQFFCPGPCYIQSDVLSPGTLSQLGWSEQGITVSLEAQFEDVLCDIGGNRIGTDVEFQGIQATIEADINFYNEPVMSALTTRLNGNAYGGISPGFLGNLMIAGGFTQRLLVVCPYFNVVPFNNTSPTGGSTGGQMVPAYNFFSTYLLDSCSVTLGTKVKKNHCVWRAIPGWFPAVSGTSFGQALIYNNDTTGVVSPS